MSGGRPQQCARILTPANLRFGREWDSVSRIGRIEPHRKAARNPGARPVSARALSLCKPHTSGRNPLRCAPMLAPANHVSPEDGLLPHTAPVAILPIARAPAPGLLRAPAPRPRRAAHSAPPAVPPAPRARAPRAPRPRNARLQCPACREPLAPCRAAPAPWVSPGLAGRA
jgi:hypothetical protein